MAALVTHTPTPSSARHRRHLPQPIARSSLNTNFAPNPASGIYNSTGAPQARARQWRRLQPSTADTRSPRVPARMSHCRALHRPARRISRPIVLADLFVLADEWARQAVADRGLRHRDLARGERGEFVHPRPDWTYVVVGQGILGEV